MAEELKVVIERDFNAPIERVWRAWTTDEQAQWSCPTGYEITEASTDLRVGGKHRATMKSAEHTGTVAGEYQVVEPPHKLVYTHFWEAGFTSPDNVTTVTVELSELAGGRTHMVFTQTGFDTVENRDGHQGGWSECFEKLTSLVQDAA